MTGVPVIKPWAGAGPSPACGGVSRLDRRAAERRLHARLAGLQAGRAITPRDAQGAWRTAIEKGAIASALISPEGLVGDAVADRRHHGGSEQAILAYAAKHYPAWEAEWAQALATAADSERSTALAGGPAAGHAESGALQAGDRRDRPAAAQDARRRLPFGAFGENFTLDGVDESNVCIGDIWAAGAIRLQVSQPREPCYKPGRYWGVPEAAARMIATRRTGWYLRVLFCGQTPDAGGVTSNPAPAGEGAPRAPSPAAPTAHADAIRSPTTTRASAPTAAHTGGFRHANAAAAIAPGAELSLVARPYPEWTVARALEVFYARKAAGGADAAAALAACPALSPKWRERLTRGG